MSSGAEQRRWLVKFAPFRTNWAEIVQRGVFTLRGVRSHVARQNISLMLLGDVVLFYHSQVERVVVGMMEVVHEAYMDPTSADGYWLTCDFKPLRTLAQPVTLQMIKAVPELAHMSLIRQPRLSVMPVTVNEFAILMHLAGEHGAGISARQSAQQHSFVSRRLEEAADPGRIAGSASAAGRVGGPDS
jgi:predicted RNA-binding protein with PUA-like domain